MIKIDEGVNGKIHAKVKQILNSKAKLTFYLTFIRSLLFLEQDK